MSRSRAIEAAKSKLIPFKKPSLAPAPKVESALIVLLDDSGSMAEFFQSTTQPKRAVAWKALHQVLAQSVGWHMGVLMFGVLEEPSQCRWLYHTGKGVLPAMPPNLMGGDTPMLPALQQAWSWLTARAEKGRIVLITDGVPSIGGAPDEILREAPTHGVPVDCIGIQGFSSSMFLESDMGFLEKLAAITGGSFTIVKDPQSFILEALKLAPINRPLLGKPR